MSKMNKLVFIILHVITWLIFVGLSIEAGGLIVNFVFSIFKPEMVGNLYQKLDLSKLHQQSEMAFYGMYSFVLFISILISKLTSLIFFKFFNIIKAFGLYSLWRLICYFLLLQATVLFLAFFVFICLIITFL